MPKTQQEKISLQGELEIPLGELAVYLLKPGEESSHVVNVLETKTEYVNNEITKIVKNILSKKVKNVTLHSLEFDYCDSGNINHGAGIFCATLSGMENDLRKVAGDDKLFYFDWEEGKKEAC
ncbi:MAG TPA: hypothetical protein VK809_04350 [Bacteroidia bacterium]|jgi:hypothetical protein|nr:hypothetical protein [Bacteroidia bacterium]